MASVELPTFGQSSHPAMAPTPQEMSADSVSSAASGEDPTRSSQTPRSPVVEKAALPLFPKAKKVSFSTHRNDANAALALDLLGDVQQTVESWHQALRQTLTEIQAVYLSGPIVEGWLEAVPEGAAALLPDAGVLRHGDATQVAAYVEKISQVSRSRPATSTSAPTQYRLCSLDAEGQIQCQLCPPDQLGAVSQAIARHQQLRQLLSQKLYFEARLKRASEVLGKARQALGITHPPSLS